MASQGSPNAPGERRVIKRYSNRKLYDTVDSRYVTLQQIGEMVRAGDDVQIIDNKSKEDKTEATLALILSEDLKTTPSSVPLSTLRSLLQERAGGLLSTLREGPIGRLIPSGEEEASETVEVKPPDPAPEAAVPVAASEADTHAGPETDGEDGDKPKGRLNHLVASSRQTIDQWQANLDERVGAVVPGLSLIRELRADVAALHERVRVLEERLDKMSQDQDS